MFHKYRLGGNHMGLIETIKGASSVFPEQITNEWINSMPRRQLTEKEKALPYAKYYYKDMEPIPQADLDIVNHGSILAEDALPITDRNKLLDTGYLKTETGYCLMEDGTGFVATKVFMKDVTPQMLDWWFNWHPLVGLRYAIWCPVAHVGISAATPEKHKDASGVDLHVRNYGKSHFPVEGFDLKGAEKIRIRFYFPEQLELDMEKFKEPNISSLFTATVTKEMGPVKFPINIFMHCVRKVEGGVEYRSRYWLGWEIDKYGHIRHSKIKIPKETMLAMARSNCIHSLMEYNNLGSLLPLLYKEQEGKIV